MKKKYIKTEMEIIEFDVEDVITTSDPTGQGGSDDDMDNLSEKL